MTLQLLACLARVQLLAACSRESPTRSNRKSLFFLHTLEHFFTLSHSLPLQESHLNTGLLIAEIQENLAWNKANKMVDKIQPYNKFEGKKLVKLLASRSRVVNPIKFLIPCGIGTKFGYHGGIKLLSCSMY